MLMLTHSWLLEHFLGTDGFHEMNEDLYVYNICPDFLPILKGFTSDMTHGVSRFREIPAKYGKASFIQFHLMVDDISHHGLIDRIPVKEFNPESNGYTYIKGKALIEPLMDLYRSQGRPIDLPVAAYRSHMIIEMTFDLALYLGLPEESKRLMVVMCDAVQRMTRVDKLNEFSEMVGWFYDSDPKVVAEAMRQCAAVYTLKRMNSFMSMEGRIKVFMAKFGLDPSNGRTFSILEKIMTQGMDLAGDYEEFLDPTLAAIEKVGFNSSTLI
jgi:hypothetical protein